MARVRRNPEFDAWFLAHVGAQVKQVTEAVARDAISECPIDSGDLVESVGTRYPGKLHGIVVVGTDHWHETEYGSPPHEIRSHGKWSLRSDEGVYFGRRVWHPGTPSQPFMRRALYRRRALGRAAVR
jgi:hypothetical protein